MNKEELAKRATTKRSVKTVSIKAPLVGRGYVIFVEVAPHKWFCDECLDRVIPSLFEAHIRKHH